MIKVSVWIGSILLSLGFTTGVAIARCDGGSLGIDAGFERLHSHTKLELELPAGIGTYSQTTNRDAQLQYATIAGEAPLGCVDVGNSNVAFGGVGTFQLGQGNGQIDDPLDNKKKVDVNIGSIAAGPKGCFFFPSHTNLCLGLLVRSEAMKLGKDFETTGGSLTPIVGIEQGLAEHLKIRLQAAYTATETKLDKSTQDFNQSDYTLGLAYVFGGGVGGKY